MIAGAEEVDFEVPEKLNAAIAHPFVEFGSASAFGAAFASEGLEGEAFVLDAFHPSGLEVSEGFGGADGGEDDLFVDVGDLERGFGPAFHFDVADSVGDGEDGFEDGFFTEHVVVAFEFFGVIDEVVHGLDGFGAEVGGFDTSGGFDGDEEPVELMAESAAEFWGVGAVTVSAFPLAEILCLPCFVGEGHLFDAFEIEVVGIGVATDGGAESGEGSAVAGHHSTGGGFLDFLEAVEEELAVEFRERLGFFLGGESGNHAQGEGEREEVGFHVSGKNVTGSPMFVDFEGFSL